MEGSGSGILIGGAVIGIGMVTGTGRGREIDPTGKRVRETDATTHTGKLAQSVFNIASFWQLHRSRGQSVCNSVCFLVRPEVGLKGATLINFIWH